MSYDDFMKRLAVALFSVFWGFGAYSMLTRPERRIDGVLLVIVILSVFASLVGTKLGRKQISLYDYGRWVLGGFGTWLVFGFAIAGESTVQGVLATIAAIGIVVWIIIAVSRNRWRDEREGFRVESYSGPDGGIVVYIEGEKRLVLLYSREKDVVFVPADSKWKQVMPEWARDRKNEIVARVKQRHGKRVMGNPIGYEETDLDEWTAPH